MVEAGPPRMVFEGAEAFIEASKLPGCQWAGAGNVGFLFQQDRRQLGSAEYFACIGFEFPQIEGLGLLVFRVLAAGVAGKSGTAPDLLESAGLAAGATEAGFATKISTTSALCAQRSCQS